jgi:hypothetical protein
MRLMPTQASQLLCSLAPIKIYDYGEYYEYQIDIINGKLAAETLKTYTNVHLHMKC